MATNNQIRLVATGYCMGIDDYLQSKADERDKPDFIIDRDGTTYGIRTRHATVALVNVGPVVLQNGLWMPAQRNKEGAYIAIEGATPVRVPYEYCSCKKYHGCQHFEMYPDKQLESLRMILKDLLAENNITFPWDNQLGAVCPRAIHGGSGIYLASSFDKERSDLHPQKELIDIIKYLSDDYSNH